jgi:protein O-mannosyl-transferase
MQQNKKYKQTNNIKSTKKRLGVYLLLLVIVPSVLYFRIINFNFTNFDDTPLIIDHYNTLNNLENIPKAFGVDAFFSQQTSFYRPLQTVSFMIDAQISGQNPWAYHFSHLILHILIVIVLFTLLIKLEIKREIALILSLLYSVHPLITSAVCWIPARGDLFLTLFGILSFLSFIEYYRSKKVQYIIFHSICFFLACLAKETAVVFPFLLTFYYYLSLKKERSWKEIFPFLIIWCGSFLVYFLLRNNAISKNNPSSIAGITAFIKNLPAIPITFGKIFVPFDLTTMPLFNNISIMIGILIFIISVFMIIKFKVYKNPYLNLGAMWFLGFTLPPLYYRLKIAEFSAEYFEHRTLLPMIGILIMIGILFNIIFNKWSPYKIYRLFIPVLIIYAIVAIIHSGDYSDPVTFFTASLTSNSKNVGALNSRGVEYMHSGNIEQAQIDFDKAIEIYPYYSSPYYNKGLINYSAHDDNKAEYYFSQALKYDTLLPGVTSLRSTILYNLAREKITLKKYNEVILLLTKSLSISPGEGDLYNNLGYAYFFTGRYDSAVDAYSKAIELQPNSSFFYTNRGGVKFHIKDFKGALSDYTRARELDPNSASTWFNTGNTKLELNDFEGAITDLSTAIKMNPKWGAAYFHRGTAYAKLNKLQETRDDWEQAKRLGYKEVINEK